MQKYLHNLHLRYQESVYDPKGVTNIINTFFANVDKTTKRKSPKYLTAPRSTLQINYAESSYLSLVASHETWTFIGSSLGKY